MPSRPMSFLSRSRKAGHDLATVAVIGRRFIDLATDEIVVEPSSSVCEGAMAAVNAEANRYVDLIGLTSLRRAVAEKLSVETRVGWSAEEIVITTGAQQALLYAAVTVLAPGDEVIIIRPWRPILLSQVVLAGAAPVFVDARCPRYIPDISAIRVAVTPQTKAIIINSPNNPTGAVYNRTILQDIGELAIERQIWIISDECYSGLVFTGFRHHESIVMAHPRVRSRTIIVKSFSRELMITGWRLGYFAAPAQLVSAVRKLQSHAIATPNVIAQQAILHHLQASDGSFEEQIYQRLVDARNIGLHILSDLRDVTPSRADGSFCFYLNLSRLLSALRTEGSVRSADDIARVLLEEANVGCVPGDAFGDANGLRLSFGAPPELLEMGLKRIVEALNGLRRGQPGT
ncbi:aminotransferase class I/II-fold pyridoxal phosphate-dependent enzyme [Bradyrhizobium sp. WYCCWR 13022]|uniref:pyridoxal phosphate-dependent aminotransferase n=1 Tax=Bradyrhizobium TaxID=374 RepID=UPI001EDBF61B|nr:MULTISPECIES: aminotransferase class I/II-fold pyridoxal phosphate-dependent enzyme [Bradyrhizobium]MCG2645016.1 aminotransferase class I/II-fold pyridoxal phosphate-dependent enzyme [Bradyrhizobium zhengyangense]MDN4985395.1 aminotransferase class I/II-fold pyridoxal phosphate-dependent enzyme [Bradyrhizobium sp. WYCCWR 13022]